jgi:inositol oxygenase
MTVTHKFRNYTNSVRQSQVEQTYLQNHKYQTLSFVLEQKQKISQRLNKPYGAKENLELSIWEAMEKLDHIVDDSDPDTSNAQTIHAFQTAEAIRQAHPNDDWFHLVWVVVIG